MPDTTYEDAKRCPKCGNPGRVDSIRPAPADAGLAPGTKIHQIVCEFQLCRWYETFWLVQVNPDGTVPPPQDHKKSPKIYSGFEGHDEQAAAIIAAIQRDEQVMTQPGGAELDPNAGKLITPPNYERS